MFGIRAKALFVYLAVSFVLFEKGNTSQRREDKPWQRLFEPKKLFHCEFKNETYQLDTTLPIRSSMIVAHNHFHNHIEWSIFKDEVKNAFTDIIEKNPLNNVDQFIRFIKAYKNQTGDKKPLESFFDNYHVPFQPLQDPVTFLIEINRKLGEKFPHDNSTWLYMASAYVDPPKSIFRDLKNAHLVDWIDEDCGGRLIRERFQRHVAGIIKISVGNERGIILLDPGYINGDVRVNPYSVVLMEDTKSTLHGERVYGGDSNGGVLYKMGPLFALATSKLTKHDTRNVLYHIKAPFCSFMDSTTKGNLLALNHGIMSFGKNGSPKGYLSFTIVPGSVNYTIGFINKKTGAYEANTLPSDYIKPSIPDHYTVELIDKANECLNLGESNTLLSKLRIIQTEVLGNPILVDEIWNLTTKFNPKMMDSWNNAIKNKMQGLFQNLCGGPSL